TPDSSFNPRPALGPGATGSRPTSSGAGGCFNPRPAPWPGRYSSRSCVPAGFLSSFNPRPALWPDATTTRQAVWFVLNLFQSSSGRVAGRYLVLPTQITTTFPFQSSSGPGAGRYWTKTPTVSRNSWFQSSSGPAAGRYLDRQHLLTYH